MATSARHVFLGFRQQRKKFGSRPLLENFLGGIGRAFTNKNGCGRLHIGVACTFWCALYNETLAIWYTMIATPNDREVHDW